MIVYSTGLNDNPETLVARTQRALTEYGKAQDLDTRETVKIQAQLSQMYDDVFHRTHDDGTRHPYPYGEVIADLVGLGFDVRDWTGANVNSIVPLSWGKGPETKVSLTFLSRISPAKATVKVVRRHAANYVIDMERSGLWLLVSWETLVR